MQGFTKAVHWQYKIRAREVEKKRMKTVKKALSALLVLTLLLSLLVSATAATSYTGSGALQDRIVRFSVKPEEAGTAQDGSKLVKFHIYVESADGKTPIRAFSFVLEPSTGLTLATQSNTSSPDFYYDYSEAAATWLRSTTNTDGAYGEFGYTPAKKYFAAAGSNADQGIVNATEVLCIMGKVASTALGSYTLDLQEVVAGDSTDAGAMQFTRTVAPAMYAVSSSGTHLTATASSAGPIKTFTVTLSNTAMTTSSFTGGLEFNKTQLKVTEITTGAGYTALGTGAITSAVSTAAEANTNGKVGVAFVHAADKSYAAADILTVTFESRTEGKTATITPYENSYGVGADKCVTGTGTAVSVKTTLSDFQLGDVNRDGSVDVRDMQRLYNHLNKTDLLEDTSTADVNGDGSIDVRDMQRLYNHLNKTDPLEY